MMLPWRILCLSLALAAQPRAVFSFKTDVQGGHPWQTEYKGASKPDDVFLPVSAPAGAVRLYEMAEQTRGKRCADDFDCMRVLGQVCKKNKWGSGGTCQCPESTPVRINEHGQPRCVSARLIFEDCTDTAECSYLNPYVECINEVCTCGAPNILKRKDLCIPATTSKVLPNLILVLSAILISAGALLGLTAFVKRATAGEEDAIYAMSLRRGRRLREEQPEILAGRVKRIYGCCMRKVEEVVSRQGQKTAALPLRSENAVSERPTGPLHEVTVQAEVHAPYEWTKSTEALISHRELERESSNESAPVNIAKSRSLTRSPFFARSRSNNGLKSSPKTPPAEVGGPAAQEQQGMTDSNQTEFSLSKDFDSIMRLVLQRVSAAEKLKVGAKEEELSLLSRKETEGSPPEEDLISDAAKSNCARTQVKPPERLQTKPAQGASSVDEVSYGDACRIHDNDPIKVDEVDARVGSPGERLQTKAPQGASSVDEVSYGDACRIPDNDPIKVDQVDARDGSPLDKGGGEAKTKTYVDVSTLCQILTPQVHGRPFSAKGRQGCFRQSDAVSERRCGRGVYDLPLFVRSHFESYRRLPGTIDAYPLVQKPRRTYLLKDEQCGIFSDSLHSCSDTSYSRMARQRQKSHHFWPPIALSRSDKRHIFRGVAEFRRRTRDSLNEVLAGNSLSMQPCATSSGCFSTGVSDLPEGIAGTQEEVKAVSNQEGTRKQQRMQYSELTSRGSKQERHRSIQEKLLPALVDDDCGRFGSDEDTPLLRAAKTRKKKGSKLLAALAGSADFAFTNPNQSGLLGSAGQSPRLHLESVMPGRSTSVVTDKSFPAIHSWGSTRKGFSDKADNILSTTDDRVELCSSGPSGEVNGAVGALKTREKLRKEAECAFIDPTSSSPSSGVQIPALFLMAASQRHELDLKDADAGSGESLRELVSAQPQRDDDDFAAVEDDIERHAKRELSDSSSSVPKPRRTFPVTSAKQEHLPGFSLMKDKLLNEDNVHLTESSKEDDSYKASCPGSANQKVASRPLSSLRRGDLKDIIKELMEEEYAHVLQFSAQQIQGADPVQHVETPAVSYGSQDLPAIMGHRREEEPEAPSKGLEYYGSSTKRSSQSSEQPHGRKDGSTEVVPNEPTEPETRLEFGAKYRIEDQRTLQKATVTSLQTRATLDGHRSSASLTSSRRLYTELSFPEIEASSGSDTTSSYQGPYGDAGADERTTCSSETTTTTSSGTSTSRIEDGSIEGGHLHSEINDEEKETTQLLSEVTVYTSSGSTPVLPPGPTRDQGPPFRNMDRLSLPSASRYDFIPVPTGGEQFKSGRTTPSVEKLFTSTRTGESARTRYDPTILPEPAPSVDVPSFINSSGVMSRHPDRTSLFCEEVPERQMVLQREEYLAIRNKDDFASTGSLGGTAGLPFSHRYASSSDLSADKTPISKPTPALRTRPKSASFPGMPGRRDSDAGKQRTAVPRTKSYTEYWLKTVSLFKEVTSSQLSYSTESDRIMGTESMSQLFRDTEPQASRDTQLEEANFDMLLQEGREMNPLLRTFLYLQESAYAPTPTQNTTRSYPYESHDVKGALTPLHSHLPPFAQHCEELREFVDFNEPGGTDDKTSSHKSFSLHSSADFCNVADEGPQGCAVLSESTVPIDCGGDEEQSLQTKPSNVFEDRVPILSTNATTLDNPASFEDSSSGSSRKPLKKVFRKTAPYRTPFPLCSSSRSSPAIRQSLRGFKRYWDARRGPSPSEYTTPPLPQGRFSTHHTQSLTEPVVVEALPKKSASAFSYLESNRLWNQDSLPFQHWLSAVTRASLQPVEGDAVHEASRQAAPPDEAELESAEYHDPMHSSSSSNRLSEPHEDGAMFFADFPDDDNP